MKRNRPMSNYGFYFGSVYLLLSVGLGIALGLVGVNFNTGAAAGVVLASAILTASRFLKVRQRLPDRRERWTLIGWSIAMTWGISLVLVVAVVLMLPDSAAAAGLVFKIGFWPLVIGFSVVSAVLVLILNIAYGYMARKQFEAMQKSRD